MSILKGEQIRKEFGNKSNKIVALDNINLEVNEGEMIGIIGPSGSGKSTLLNILGLLEEADSGNYYIEGKLINKISEKELASYRNKYFGFVVQHFALINDFSVYENIEIPLKYAKVKKSEAKQKIIEVLKKLKIEDKINSKASELSGGQAQRVAIARAIVNNPKVILADEPTGALDSKTEMEIMNIFKELNKEGKTILIITHDDSVAKNCDRIIKIIDGKLFSTKI
ncbi:MAG: ABC transporter ATP-binding protein [Clostridium sp.]